MVGYTSIRRDRLPAVATKSSRNRGRSRLSSDRHPDFVFSGLNFALFRACRIGAPAVRLARAPAPFQLRASAARPLAASQPPPLFRLEFSRSNPDDGAKAGRGMAAWVDGRASTRAGWSDAGAGRCQAETSGVSAASVETPRSRECRESVGSVGGRVGSDPGATRFLFLFWGWAKNKIEIGGGLGLY
ncbi:hypothetical protein NL676_003720 [Syzygium grande]|nr:hypothetical protein NL676_003720 [Syzygium grande]